MHTRQSESHFSIYYLSECALTIQFGNSISEDLLKLVTDFDHLLQQNPFPGFETTVPAYATLTVFYDPMIVNRSVIEGGDCFEKVSNYLNTLKGEITVVSVIKDTITIPVCYGSEYGPDIDEVAQLNGLDVDDVIRLHSQTEYTVYMIGFVPGFAYLGGMNNKLATPRKATPRKAVPAGSVGIAGEQTGIYPLETPGGWQIIGQTPLQLFDVHRTQPSLLKAGDRVVFEPISIDEFNRLSK